MTVFAEMSFLTFTISMIIISYFCGATKHTSEENFTSLYTLLVKIRNSTDDNTAFVTKIQTLFCPEQPICSSEVIADREELLNFLPSFLDIGQNTVRLSNVSEFLGICCLPCSCSDTCIIDNNCCMTKFASLNHTRLTGQVLSECIVPTVHSYDDKDWPKVNEYEASYVMTTRCLINDSNDDLQLEQCENPNPLSIEETGPVTSLTTGKTYWNRHCARCNNDVENVLEWSSTVKLKYDLVFFADRTLRTAQSMSLFYSYPETIEELHRLLFLTGDIIYTPPFPMYHKRCIRETSFLRCTPAGDNNMDGSNWLLDWCEKLYNPVTVHIFRDLSLAYKNIFCMFCRKARLSEGYRTDCGSPTITKDPAQLLALVDYQSVVKDTASRTQLERREEKCPCYEIFDIYLDHCRPVFCPPGEFLVGCECVEPLQNLSGVPVLITLKAVPEDNQITKGQKDKTKRKIVDLFQTQLQTTLHKNFDHITAVIAATFEQEAQGRQYFVSVAIVRSTSGYDTKRTVKPFLDYLDTKQRLTISIDRNIFYIRITSRIRLWSKHDTNTRSTVFRLKELDTDNPELKLRYLLDERVLLSPYQIMSPLLYCMQIQLNETEFYEKDSVIIVNTTTPKFSVAYYYRVDTNQSRLCTDQYFGTLRSKGSAFGTVCYIFPISVHFILNAFIYLRILHE